MTVSGLIRQRGFTLIEVLIVVVIIAVMASLIIPRFGGQSKKAEATEAVSIMSTIRRAALNFNDEHHGEDPEWPSATDATTLEAELGISFSPSTLWTFQVAPDGADSTIGTITGTHTDGDTLTLDCESGVWGGTGDYDPTTGEAWPHLNS